jgi:hypothetical protein
MLIRIWNTYTDRLVLVRVWKRRMVIQAGGGSDAGFWVCP